MAINLYEKYANKIFDKKNILILSAHKINNKFLDSFYNLMYYKSSKSHIWKWLNRYDKTPLIIYYFNQVIAHAGMIPFKILLDGKYYTASWFIDFAVLPEFQKQGLGTLLAKKWMELSDIHLAIGTHKGSNAIFKKLGWIDSPDSYLHYLYLRPFDHPKLHLFPKFLNVLSSFFQNTIYRKYTFIENPDFKILKPNIMHKFMPSITTNNMVIPIRDTDYFLWRLLNSPNRDKYHSFEIDRVYAIIKIENKYIDLLMVSDLSMFSTIRRLISTLAIWGLQNGYFYIRYYTSDRELSYYLKNSLKSRVYSPKFMFHTKDANLLGELKNSYWCWQLIDNDFERFGCTP